MNPLNFRLKPYEKIEDLQVHQIEALKTTTKIAIFFNLVVNYTGFDHPGYNRIIDQFQGKQITKPYINQRHSFNADLIICHRTIGKIKNSPQQADGKAFYECIKNSDKNVKHQASLQKINFNNPLTAQLQKLNPEQLTIITEIPKIFEHPQKIKFKQTWIQNLFYDTNFWFTMFFFLIQALIIGYWTLTNYAFQDICRKSPFLVIGGVIWTMIEYVFHRFLLHQAIPSAKKMQGHLIHHAFPKLKQKVAIYPLSTSAKFLIIAYLLSHFVSLLVISLIILGLFSTIMLYESLHYYCHFGPEIDIKWIKYMRIYHLKHHYRDQSRYFGVTNPYWDSIFGSGLDPKLKK